MAASGGAGSTCSAKLVVSVSNAVVVAGVHRLIALIIRASQGVI